MERANAILEQIEEGFRDAFLDLPEMAFDGRLLGIAKRAVKDCLTNDYDGEPETPGWSGIVKSPIEVVHTHNFAFHPTGVLREAYSAYLIYQYAMEARGFGDDQDRSVLKANEIFNWFAAWTFMEECGFQDGDLR